MKHLFNIFLAIPLLIIFSCTKQTQAVAEKIEEPTTEIVASTIDSIVKPDSTNAELEQKSDYRRFRPKYADKPVYYLEGDGKKLKVTYSLDDNGKPGAIIDEGDHPIWLFKKDTIDDVPIFYDKDLNIYFAPLEASAALTQNGKKYQLRVK